MLLRAYLNTSNHTADNSKGLVVFDVEGVLLPKKRYIPFEASRRLGFLKFIRIIIYGILYEVGLASLEIALKKIYRLFKDYSIQELRAYYEHMPLLPGAKTIVETLRSKGWKTALISSGLPALFIKDLAGKLGADYAFGLEMKIHNDKFTGEISGEVIKKNGKATVLKKILNKENLTPLQCVIIADDRNNLPMFPQARLVIGYNPDFWLTTRSDYIIMTDLTRTIPIITEADTREKQLAGALQRNDVFRSLIHIAGFSIPFLCTYVLNIYLMIVWITIVTAAYTISEMASILGQPLPVFKHITKMATVKLEFYEFATAPIFYALGIIFSLLFFPPNIAYTAIAVLTLGDGFASLFGKRFGKTRYSYNRAKNLEGTIAGFIAALLGALLFVNPTRALLGAIVGMTVETIPTPINDNLTIPLSVGIVLSATLL